MKTSSLETGTGLRLIVSDIEGCLSSGKGIPLDLTSLLTIQSHNRRVAVTRDGAPLALCTGRSQPFVEAFCQMLGVTMPCVCENGAFVYDPARDMTIMNPAITPAHIKARQQLIELVDLGRVAGLRARQEPGKDVCVSLNPDVPKENYQQEIPVLYNRIKDFADPSLFSVTHSASAVDITPKGIDKGSGVQFLQEIASVELAQMAGIGDSAGDLPFLRIVGRSAAPANSSTDVRVLVDYVSSYSAADGVMDIIAWLHGWHTTVPKWVP